MFTLLMKAFIGRKNTRRKTHHNPLGNENDWRLEDRAVPAVVTTHIAMQSVPDHHLSGGAQEVTVGRFTVDSSHAKGAVSQIVVDDTRQGAFDFVKTATLYYKNPTSGQFVALDSSPVTHPRQGGLIVFNRFGYVPTVNPTEFEVRVNAIDAVFSDVHGEISVQNIVGRNIGVKSYDAHPVPGDTGEEPLVPNIGGVQRTNYDIIPIADKTVSATDHDKVVWQGRIQSSDARAFFRCIRFIEQSSGRLDFIRTASVWHEIAPGQWDRLMTVQPDAHGRLIFPHYKVGKVVHTGGAGANVRVTVDPNPTMVGTREVDVGFYFSTFLHAGSWSFSVNSTGVTPPNPNPPSHGTLSVTSLSQPPLQAGAVNQLVATFNVGIGPNAAFSTLTFQAASGSTAGSTFRLYRSDANGVPLNQFPLLGTVISNDGTTVVIGNIGWVLDDFSNHFAVYADPFFGFQAGINPTAHG